MGQDPLCLKLVSISKIMNFPMFTIRTYGLIKEIFPSRSKLLITDMNYTILVNYRESNYDLPCFNSGSFVRLIGQWDQFSRSFLASNIELCDNIDHRLLYSIVEKLSSYVDIL